MWPGLTGTLHGHAAGLQQIGAPRKDSVDRAASVLMADAAERAGVRRFVQVSSMGAGRPPRPGTRRSS
jgi:hypothetical protein